VTVGEHDELLIEVQKQDGYMLPSCIEARKPKKVLLRLRDLARAAQARL
jgi:hypothetical protein